MPAGADLDAALAATDAARQEIKEWQAIMDYLVNLPDKNAEGIAVLTKDQRALEVRAIVP
jgi:5'-nucleotidase/UDP-sugar diphosphatase